MYLKELQPTVLDKKEMKVKMFIYHSLEGAEREMNEWMAGRNVRICHVTQSQSEKQGKFVFVVSLFFSSYED